MKQIREAWDFFVEFIAGVFWSLVALWALWYYVTGGK